MSQSTTFLSIWFTSVKGGRAVSIGYSQKENFYLQQEKDVSASLRKSRLKGIVKHI